MLVQVGSSPELWLPCDIPIISVGVPSYAGNAASYSVKFGGFFAGGAGTLNFTGPAADGPGYVRVNTNAADFPSVGPFGIFVFDAGGNLVAFTDGQCVNFNPYA